MADLHTHSNLPRLEGGHLNEIFYNTEKQGGPRKFLSILDSFHNVFLDVGPFDLNFLGNEWTWCNFKENGITVEECLDRFCGNTNWSLLFPIAQVSVLIFVPILLKNRT